MIALVTGANKGLGLGVSEELASKGHTVIMTARNAKALEESVAKLKAKKLNVIGITLDISNTASIEETINKLLRDYKQIDILINNAGIYNDGLNETPTALAKTVTTTLQTNTIGPATLIQAVLPTMKKNNFGRIVNVSSGMGGLAEMGGGYLSYRISKSALNAVTRVFAAETTGSDILVNSVCPGWVKTDMGGAGATRNLPEGVASIVWAANLPKGGPTGGFFRDGKPLAW